MQLTHLGTEGGLIPGLGGNAPHQGGDLRPGLHKPEHIVDKEQHILALGLKPFGLGNTGFGHLKARARRLIHLAERHDDLRQNALMFKLVVKLVSFANAFAYPREHTDAVMLLGHIVNDLLNDHALAAPRATENACLAPLHDRIQEIDHLNACLKHLPFVLGDAVHIDMQFAGVAVNGPVFSSIDGPFTVDRLPHHVDNPAEQGISHRHFEHAPRGGRQCISL